MSNYWKDREANSLNKVSNKSVTQVEKQLKRYYGTTMQRIIYEFESTLIKLRNTVGSGREPTPADLYKLDKYWEMQAQLRYELQKLGDMQMVALSKSFEECFHSVYNTINIKGATTFNTIDNAMVKQMINSVWCADGKSWSQRVWGNMDLLQQTLNDGLIEIVAAGKRNRNLKKLLQESFNVSYSRADALVRTEVAHIQTEAAKKRYEDYGIQEVEFWAEPDERTCEVCGKLHKKRYPVGAAVPIPAHPRCRCVLLPVVE